MKVITEKRYSGYGKGKHWTKWHRAEGASTGLKPDRLANGRSIANQSSMNSDAAHWGNLHYNCKEDWGKSILLMAMCQVILSLCLVEASQNTGYNKQTVVVWLDLPG